MEQLHFYSDLTVSVSSERTADNYTNMKITNSTKFCTTLRAVICKFHQVSTNSVAQHYKLKHRCKFHQVSDHEFCSIQLLVCGPRDSVTVKNHGLAQRLKQLYNNAQILVYFIIFEGQKTCMRELGNGGVFAAR